MTAPRLLTAAVIGCGHGGRLSLAALCAIERYEIVGAADPSEAARTNVSAAFPHVPLLLDYEDLSGSVDVSCIATPAPLHEPVARDMLSRGIAGLLLEKPMACDADTASALLHDVMALGIPMVVPHGMLELPAPCQIMCRIRSGDIGEIISVDVQNSVDLLNAGIHWLVYLLELFGEDQPEAVESEFDTSDRVVNDGVHVETAGRTRIVTQSGCRWTLMSGKSTRPVSDVLPTDEQVGAIFRIKGTTGTVEFSAWSGSYRLTNRDAPRGELVTCDDGTAPSYHQVFLEQLGKSIDSGRPDFRSAELSVAALRLVDCAYRSRADRAWPLGIPVSED